MSRDGRLLYPKTKPCQICGTEFTPHETKRKRAKTCSHACGVDLHAKTRRESDVPGRFWKRVDRTGECWVWTKSVDSCGYGHLRFYGKLMKAQRVSWILQYGDIPDGMHVLHRCDNPPCVRVDHLFLGTHRTNMADMASKGRAASSVGDANSGSRLSESDVLEIRGRVVVGNGGNTFALAKEYGVSAATISMIARRKTWSHI